MFFWSILDNAKHIDVTVVNSEIYENSSGAAIQPSVVLEVFHELYGLRLAVLEVEIVSTSPVIRDFAFVIFGLGHRLIGVRPPLRKVFYSLLFILRPTLCSKFNGIRQEHFKQICKSFVEHYRMSHRTNWMLVLFQKMRISKKKTLSSSKRK